MDWRLIAAGAAAFPTAIVIGTTLIRLSTLRVAYAEIDRVFPDAIFAFNALAVALIASGCMTVYLFFSRTQATAEEIADAVAAQEPRLREKILAAEKAARKVEEARLREAREGLEEREANIRQQIEKLNLVRLQTEVEKADALILKKDAEKLLGRATEAGAAADGVLDALDRSRAVYQQLSELLERITENPEKLAAHLDPERVERQIKKLQDGLQRCSAYWDQMDTLRFGEVVEDEEAQTAPEGFSEEKKG